ncbi:MAG: hypothetical protein LBK01_01180 [Burkholderiaceae bacterium]|nr:hypothetical protein [Burkholderiaceae bacterium]
MILPFYLFSNKFDQKGGKAHENARPRHILWIGEGAREGQHHHAPALVVSCLKKHDGGGVMEYSYAVLPFIQMRYGF